MDPVDFVEKYGSYLHIHSCLVFASSIGDESAIAALLKAASNDPTHKEAVKEIEKSNDLMFYDSVSSSNICMRQKRYKCDSLIHSFVLFSSPSCQRFCNS
jgi:hypothetical protein